MYRCLRILIVFFAGLLLANVCEGQIRTTEEQVHLEILQRGISEDDLRLALSNKGIDFDNLQSLSTEQIQEISIIIEELQIQSQLNGEGGIPFDPLLDTIPDEGIFTSIDSTEVDFLEDLIEDTSRVAIWGHQNFNNGQISLIEDEEGYIPPETHIIGAGDELSVGIFGSARVDESFVIDNKGSISIYPTQNSTGNVKVFVGGLTVSQAREKLISDFKKYYRFSPSQFSLAVSAVRKVRVSVLGEVQKAGEFVVSGRNSVFNLIAAAGGFTDIGGMRKITLIKKNGNVYTIDLYKIWTDPQAGNTYPLENGDIISIPTAQNLIDIKGAVRREHTYELLEGEGIVELILYAGGLDRGASLTSIDVNRFDGEKQVFKEIPYAKLIKDRVNYPLMNGDLVEIRRIEEVLENYVSIVGEVRNPGNYELIDGLTIKDLLLYGVLKPTSRRDKAYIQRTNPDGNISVIPISIADIIHGNGIDANMVLEDRDKITVWPLERFTDNKTIVISGSVREPIEFDYDIGGTLRVSDAITFAGGLKSDAAIYAHIHRLDPLNPQELSYVRIDIDKAINEPNAVDNIFLEPYDSIHIYKRNEFLEDVTISIFGAVNNPGTFAYGNGMTLVDAITFAGGFRLSSATNHIEVSRVIINDNQRSKTIVEKVALTRDELSRFQNTGGQYRLEPYDNVFVRYVPEFELQQNVTIIGEVKLPGEYSLIRDNETVYDLIKRAEGLTEEAFPAAATINRTEDDLGLLVMRLDEVMEDPNSKFNYALKNLDTIMIPKIKDYVRIVGYAQDLIVNNKKQTTTPFHKDKDALFYINEYAGGFADNARRNKVFVKYPNGEVKTTIRRFPFGKKHPKVVPGSIISIGPQPVNPSPNKNEEDVNWTKVLGDSVAQAMSILTLILLVQRLD
ncbi:MAG: protein involved in polysaccharide export with SLBB domain [Saprospiraceae bacterium]|jgi:protein involved in polysaccharide export with SLBB domain